MICPSETATGDFENAPLRSSCSACGRSSTNIKSCPETAGLEPVPREPLRKDHHGVLQRDNATQPFELVT